MREQESGLEQELVLAPELVRVWASASEPELEWEPVRVWVQELAPELE